FLRSPAAEPTFELKLRAPRPLPLRLSLLTSVSRLRLRRDEIIEGGISDAPLPTSLTASMTSVAARDLWMNAPAPASIAASQALSLSSRLRQTNRALGWTLRIARAASRPVPSRRRQSLPATSA